MKRFLRDGYGTVMEDRNRKYYRAAEVKVGKSFSVSDKLNVEMVDLLEVRHFYLCV